MLKYSASKGSVPWSWEQSPAFVFLMPVPASALCYGNGQQGSRPGCMRPRAEDPERKSREPRCWVPLSRFHLLNGLSSIQGLRSVQNFSIWNELELFTSSWLFRPNSAREALRRFRTQETCQGILSIGSGGFLLVEASLGMEPSLLLQDCYRFPLESCPPSVASDTAG